jgi:integrase
LCWLNEYKQTPTTHRNYQKEAERLLLWCIYNLKKPLSSLDREDFTLYFEFLSNPKPTSIWCAPSYGKNGKRGTPEWRPFIGPLSESAKNTAIRIINSLFDYLVASRYLAFNPISLIKQRTNRKGLNSDEETLKLQERILELDEWQAMLKTLNDWPTQTMHEKNELARLRFLVAILFFLGLRVNELVTHTWRAFRKNSEGWWFYVKGKGGKEGKIPVNPSLLIEIEQFRTHLALGPLPVSPELDTPIIPSWRSGEGLQVRAIGKLLKLLALETAKKFPDNKEKQEKLSKFSPHWLRHLSASMQDRAGIAFKHIQGNLRHSSESTTRRYVHAYDEERHKDMEKLQWNIILS